MTAQAELDDLLARARDCRHCEKYLPLGPRPVLSAHTSARIVLIGQAPGTAVHETGVPWNDPSGRRLRDWMGVEEDIFYDPQQVALIPMGFCYPGRGRSGDNPPRPECAPLWHQALLNHLNARTLMLLIGQYAQAAYLVEHKAKTLTETVRNWRSCPYGMLPMPHPSPRNNIWLRRNPWFEQEFVPELRACVATALE